MWTAYRISFVVFWSIVSLWVSEGYAQPRPVLTVEEQLEIVNFYAVDLERSLKRCQLERADLQAQGTRLKANLAAVKAQPSQTTQDAEKGKEHAPSP